MDKSKGKVAVNKILFILLVLTIFLQAAYFLQKERLNSGLTNSLNSIFSFSRGQNNRLSAEVDELSALIAEREASILELSRDKESFRSEVTDLKLQLAQFKRLLKQAGQEKNSFQARNEELAKEISGLKEDLRLYSGRISNKGEAKVALARRKKALSELRRRMSDLRVQARAQNKRITMVLGNQGYLFKEGKTTFSREDTIRLEKIVVIKGK